MQSTDAPSRITVFIRAHGTKLLALLLSLAITAAVFAYRDELGDLQELGYIGVFLVAVLSNATLVLPVPGIAVTFAAGGVLNPWLVGLVAGIGEPLGELTGYLAGYGGSAVVENRERYERIKGWMEHRGFLTLFVLSVVPNPLFDLAGITAGMLRYPVWRFLLACWLGKTVKALAIAFIGSLSLDWLSGIIP